MILYACRYKLEVLLLLYAQFCIAMKVPLPTEHEITSSAMISPNSSHSPSVYLVVGILVGNPNPARPAYIPLTALWKSDGGLNAISVSRPSYGSFSSFFVQPDNNKVPVTAIVSIFFFMIDRLFLIRMKRSHQTGWFCFADS